LEYTLLLCRKSYSMKKQSLKKKNESLTNWVIILHQTGYINDFFPFNNGEVQCVQNGENFPIKDLRVILIDCCYDLLTRSFRYIHTIDTEAGYRGLLITNRIVGLSC